MKQENHNKKGKSAWIVLLIILAILLVIGGGIFWFLNSKLNLIQFDDGSREIDTSASCEVNNDELEIGDLPNGPAGAQADGDKLEILHDDDVFNVLLLGTDERTNQFSDNARADSIMVLSLNTKQHTIKLVSIERGIGVPVPGRNDDWLTHTFRYGGAKLTMDTVRELFRVDVDRYVRVNFNVFETGINAIGGVDLNLTEAEATYLRDANMYNGKHPNISKQIHPGVCHLDGDLALQYGRLREIDSDWKRIERQRKVIQAALNQVKGLGIGELNDLVNTILPMVQTNLTKGEIAKLAMEIPGFVAGGAQIEDMTVPAEGTAWNSVGVDGRKMIGVDFNANAKILRELFYGVTE